MITDISSLKNQLDAISDLLLIADNQPKTVYITNTISFNDISKEDLVEWHRINFASFPLYTQPKSDELTFHHAFFQCYHKYHKLPLVADEPNVERIREVTELERDGVLVSVEEYVLERAQNFFDYFGAHIDDLKKHPAFACIDEPALIMKNLLNHYVQIRHSEDLQIAFFHHLTLPKHVADQLTDFLIPLLSDRITMLDPIYKPPHLNPSAIEATNKIKIKWLAKQQEFAELIHTLADRGYIEMPDISVAAQSRFLADVFDFSKSQRKEGANTANNLLTYLKPIQDEAVKQTTHSYLTPSYKKRFDSIINYQSVNKR